MANVFETAGWFLAKAPMDHKKIQKLCYYAQAWSLVLNDRTPLFDGDFEAWAHGPVNRDLWNRLEEYGYLKVPNEALLFVGSFSDKEQEILGCVWDTYGDMTGFQLEDLTHEEAPWREARGNTPHYAPSTAVISKDSMYGYYKAQYSGDGIGE